ncbi:RdgB/HAM1 family non-canonical purine NTP pyrophosphatase [Patescibacteria group bacterium]
MKLLVATTNKNKLKEYQKISPDLSFDFITLNQINSIPKDFDLQETGTTFKQNAIIKAKAYGELANIITLADDTGLCIDYLNGFPGIHSARFAQNNFQSAIKKILSQLKNVPLEKRTAQFKITLALFNPSDKSTKTFSATAKGRITLKPVGKHGFGYDPIFFCFDTNKTYAQMSDQDKNQHSHRAKAFKKLKQYLTSHYPEAN